MSPPNQCARAAVLVGAALLASVQLEAQSLLPGPTIHFGLEAHYLRLDSQTPTENLGGGIRIGVVPSTAPSRSAWEAYVVYTTPEGGPSTPRVFTLGVERVYALFPFTSDRRQFNVLASGGLGAAYFNTNGLIGDLSLSCSVGEPPVCETFRYQAGWAGFLTMGAGVELPLLPWFPQRVTGQLVFPFGVAGAGGGDSPYLRLSVAMLVRM